MTAVKGGATTPVPASRRFRHWPLWLVAAVTAVAVHGMLLGLFRYAPKVNPPESDELPAVGTIDLALAENGELGQWLVLHDPSLLIAPSVENGYSMVMAVPVFRNGVEDLPHPPVLSVPGAPTSKAPRIVLNTEISAILSAGNAAWHPDPAMASPVRVSLDGRDLPLPGRDLTRWRDGLAPSKKFPAAGKITEVELGSERLPGLGARLRLIRSCGDAEFDRQAVLYVAAYLRRIGLTSGVVAVDWGVAPERNAAR